MIKQRIMPPGELAAVLAFQRRFPAGGPSDGSDHPLSLIDDALPHAGGCGCYLNPAGDETTDARCAALRLRGPAG